MLERFAKFDEEATQLLRQAAAYEAEAAYLKRHFNRQVKLLNDLLARPSNRQDVIVYFRGGKWFCQLNSTAPEDEDAVFPIGIGDSPEEACVSFDLTWAGIIPGDYK